MTPPIGSIPEGMREQLDDLNAKLAKAEAERDEAARREVECQTIMARIRKVRDGYADQAKFADVDPASYFREFVRRLDQAVEGE